MGESTELLKMLIEGGKEEKGVSELMKLTLGLGKEAAPLVEEITQISGKLKAATTAGQESELLAQMSDKVSDITKLAEKEKSAEVLAKWQSVQKAIKDAQEMSGMAELNAAATARIKAANDAKQLAETQKATAEAQKATAEAQKATAEARKAAAANPGAPGFGKSFGSSVGKVTGKAAGVVGVTGAVGAGTYYFGVKPLINQFNQLFAAKPPSPPANAHPLNDKSGNRVKDKYGNDAFGQSQCDLPFVPLEEDLAKNSEPGRDGKPQVIWNPAQEEPGVVDNFCKWIYDHTQGWDPTLQRIAFAAVPLIGAVIGAFAMPGLSSILGIGLALLAAWKGPEFVADHANVVTQHDEWAKTHPAKPFNNAAAGTTVPARPQQQLPAGSLIPAPAPH